MEKTDSEIIDIYRGLWRIEETFKVTKSELDDRPVYVSTKNILKHIFNLLLSSCALQGSSTQN